MSYRPITDLWFLGRPKVPYYGAYPSGFLVRARALLGVTLDDVVLHVCGGRARDYGLPQYGVAKGVPQVGFGPYDQTLDLDASLSPDFHQPATQAMPARVTGEPWDALIADPPYTEADADKYAPGRAAFPSANLILRNMLAAVRPGGRVGMLHYILPQPPKKGVRFVACIGVIVGFNNRMRCYSVFERL